MWIPRRRLLPPRGIAALLFVSFLFACQDTPTNTPDVPGPQFDISEARFGDGNPDFFFAAPLAETPQSGDKNFDDGAANETLVPAVRVCVTADADGDDQDPEVPDGNIEDHTGCVEDVTATVTGSDTGLPMTFNADTELFQVNWKTDLLDPVKEYRIEVWALEFPTEDRQDFEAITFPSDHSLLADQPRWLFGWRDIDDSPNSASCDGTEEFCLINYGQTLPVKVRIEDFVFCPVSRNCAVQFVPSGEDAVLQALVGAEEDRVQ
nr:hypothetical protein [Gemmatimonadota bacterium]